MTITQFIKMNVQSVVHDVGARFYINDAVNSFPSTLESFASFISSLPLQQLIRLAWIIGGYILLRPYLEFGFRKLFANQKEHESDAIASAAEGPPRNGNAADGVADYNGMNSGATSGLTAWGAAARKREAMIRQAWVEEQARLAEELDFDGIDPDLLEE